MIKYSLFISCVVLFSSCFSVSNLIKEGEYKAADEYCRTLPDGQRETCFEKIADAYFDMEKYDEAVEYYEFALKPYEGYKKAAIRYLVKGELEKGTRYCEKVSIKSIEEEKACYWDAAEIAKSKALNAYGNGEGQKAAVYFESTAYCYKQIDKLDNSQEFYLKAAKLYMYQLAELKNESKQDKENVMQNIRQFENNQPNTRDQSGNGVEDQYERGMRLFEDIAAQSSQGYDPETYSKIVKLQEKLDHCLGEAVFISKRLGDDRNTRDIRNNMAFKMLCINVRNF